MRFAGKRPLLPGVVVKGSTALASQGFQKEAWQAKAFSQAGSACARVAEPVVGKRERKPQETRGGDAQKANRS
jgi:hypothetical protein